MYYESSKTPVMKEKAASIVSVSAERLCGDNINDKSVRQWPNKLIPSTNTPMLEVHQCINNIEAGIGEPSHRISIKHSQHFIRTGRMS